VILPREESAVTEPAPASAFPAIDEDLLRILVCPIDHASLRMDGADLVCTRCGRRYPVEDGIPNMLVEPL
jgi:uncharacterized protein YbaR (Trm112 family)